MNWTPEQIESATPEALLRWDRETRGLGQGTRWHFLMDLVDHGRCFSPEVVEQVFGDEPALQTRLVASPHFPVERVEVLLRSQAARIRRGERVSEIRRLLAVLARRGGWRLEAELLAELRGALEAGDALLDPGMAELCRERLAPHEALVREGVVDPERVRQRVLQHYCAVEVESLDPPDQDPGGILLVGHPACTPEAAEHYLAECDNPALALEICYLAGGVERREVPPREDYLRHPPLRHRLRGHLEQVEVAGALLAFPDSGDFVLAFDALRERRPEILYLALQREEVTVEALGWLGPARLARVLESPWPETRLRAMLATALCRERQAPAPLALAGTS